MTGILRERLEHAEYKLRQAGMCLYPNGGAVYPWPGALRERVREWLTSYLAHFRWTSSRRLTELLWKWFFWLGEYFRLVGGGKVKMRLSAPRVAFTVREQQRCFLELLPGHVLVLEAGRFWDMLSRDAQARPLRFHARKLDVLESWLWESVLPVAWIGETGRRGTSIEERVLVCRWSAGKASCWEEAGSRQWMYRYG